MCRGGGAAVSPLSPAVSPVSRTSRGGVSGVAECRQCRAVSRSVARRQKHRCLQSRGVARCGRPCGQGERQNGVAPQYRQRLQTIYLWAAQLQMHTIVWGVPCAWGPCARYSRIVVNQKLVFRLAHHLKTPSVKPLCDHVESCHHQLC